MRLFLLLLAACSGSTTGDDTSTGDADADTDTDTDTDADTDADTDTDTDPRDAIISGTVLLWDGSPAAEMEVQVCSIQCRYAITDASGNFSQGLLESARFKVDAIGAVYSSPGFGNALVGVDLGVSENFVISAPLVVPPVSGPVSVSETAGRATYDVGAVSLTFAATDLAFTFGVVDNDTGLFDLYAGALEGAAIPQLWSVQPSFVVTFLPWAAENTGTLDVTVTGLTSPDGSYTVYALEEYGEVEGPLGTATVSGGTATATGLAPSHLTWLMFVPA